MGEEEKDWEQLTTKEKNHILTMTGKNEKPNLSEKTKNCLKSLQNCFSGNMVDLSKFDNKKFKEIEENTEELRNKINELDEKLKNLKNSLGKLIKRPKKRKLTLEKKQQISELKTKIKEFKKEKQECLKILIINKMKRDSEKLSRAITIVKKEENISLQENLSDSNLISEPEIDLENNEIEVVTIGNIKKKIRDNELNSTRLENLKSRKETIEINNVIDNIEGVNKENKKTINNCVR